MALITLTCPLCGFSREIDPAAIPVRATLATCPRCRQAFPLEQSVSSATGEDRATLPLSSLSYSSLESTITSPRTVAVTFTGTAGEYFGIWIVNTLLKIVTLGVYTAWAKVRRRRYFYGSTHIDTIPFDYLADPLVLLKGWLIGVGLFILYSIGTQVGHWLSSTLGSLFFVSVPWLIVRSRMFSLRNSSHRNIRFHFRENYEEAYLVFAGLVILTPLTLGLLLPYTTFRQRKFFVENSSYGTTPFTFVARPREFYQAYLKTFGLFLLTAALLGLLVFLGSTYLESLQPFLHPAGGDRESFRKGATLAVACGVAVVIAASLVVMVYLRTLLTNITWNATGLGADHFTSSLRARRMAWLYISNTVAIICSCGLLIPWASIRLTRYRLSCLALTLVDDPAEFAAAGDAVIDAAGEEIGDVFGIDMSL
jgi:uncharacterized membrane protein YjgN (DUF898 family)